MKHKTSYGNLCPKTWQGRLVTIIYALIGIPMTVMCLTNMGSTLASCFRFLYKKVILKLVRRRRHVESGLRIEVLKASLPPLVVSSDSGDCELAKEENTELSPGENSTKQVVLKQIYEEDSDKLVRVPLPVTVFILTSYVCVGAFMFTLWEKDWDFLTSAYCCFITLSTIGFGDFVPGMNSLDGEAKRVIAILYLFFGLMTLAMCFELVQQEVRDRFRDIGLWLGVVERKKSKTGSVREKQKNVQ